MEIDLKPRTTTDVEPRSIQFSFSGRTSNLILDIHSPTQRQIMECFEQGRLFDPAATLNLAEVLRPGDVFIDVGAHVGYFSVLASPIVGTTGRVIAIEPNRTNFAFLKTNVQVNNLANVILVNAAAGEFHGQTQFYENLDNDGGHALWNPALHPFNQRTRSSPKVETIPIETLDRIVASQNLHGRVRCIKIDTEGAELKVSCGATQCLADPGVRLVICEYNEFGLHALGSNGNELRAFYQDRGFTAALPDADARLNEVGPGQSISSVAMENLFFLRDTRPADVGAKAI